MPSINANATDIPTEDDLAYWTNEIAAYEYHPPNPGVPSDRVEYGGWGIPPDRLAPKDAVDYVLGKYREEELDLYHHDPRDEYKYTAIHPMYKWTIISAVWAHFLWFRTKPGAAWILQFFGVQEVEPFYSACIYQWVDPRQEELHTLKPPEFDQDGRMKPGFVKLQIFRQWERVVHPACPGETTRGKDTPFDQMTKLLEQYRDPLARDPGEWKEKVFNWVSEKIRNWFLEPSADDRWPTYRRGRLSGTQWVRALERSQGKPFYEALSKIAKYQHASYRNKSVIRAYRIQDANGGVHWCAGSEMRIIPKLDYHQIQKDLTDDQLESEFGCKGCRHRRTCVPHSGSEGFCCHCYAQQIEQGTHMPTLDLCTMIPECKNCPDRIDSNTVLINLKQKWNRGPSSPIPR